MTLLVSPGRFYDATVYFPGRSNLRIKVEIAVSVSFEPQDSVVDGQLEQAEDSIEFTMRSNPLTQRVAANDVIELLGQRFRLTSVTPFLSTGRITALGSRVL